MSIKDKTHGETGAEDEMTPDLELALREFRQSVHAWSEAAMNRPRLAVPPRRRLWRLAAGWALSGLLIVGGLSAGVFERHRQQVTIAQARMAEHERLAAEQRLQQARLSDEDLLAKVDVDVSQAVPSAMEPLAQLMAEDESK
jgi:hypothetical protein